MSEFLASLNNPKAEESAAAWEAEVAKTEAELKPPVEEKSAPDVSHETKAEVVETEQKIETVETKVEDQSAKETKQIPLAVLLAERKDFERKLADLERRLTPPVQEQPKTEEEQPPDPETDPIGALKYNQKKWAEFQQQQQQNAYRDQLTTAYQRSLHSYMAVEPAFKDAYEHALKSRAQELTAYGMSEGEIDAALKNDQLQLAETAIRQGKNPAEMIYKFAEARGFQKKAPEQKPVIPVIDPAVEKAKADAAVSLTTGGKPPANELTEEEALRTLKGAALDSWIDKRWKAMEQAAGRKSSLFPN
jgi:hypothetical protein